MLLYFEESSNFDKRKELPVLKHTTEAGIPAIFLNKEEKTEPSDSMGDQKSSRNRKYSFQLALHRWKNNVEIQIIDMMHDQVLQQLFW